MSANRTTWKDGQSGNRAGYSKAKSDAAKQLARMIQEETRSGAELLEFALAVYRHNPMSSSKALEVHGLTEVTLDDKKWAHGWLSDRGFGKALQVIEVAGEGESMPAIVLTAKTDAELDAAERVLAESLGDGRRR
jgi:hypothetical protein